MNLITKDVTTKLEDVNTSDGVIQVYVSAFNSKDSDGDVIVPGAFTRTINSWGPQSKNRIWFLKNHDTSKEIAKPFEIKQDNYGLLFSVKMPRYNGELTTSAKDLLALYQEGHITEHSVGFVTEKQSKKSDYNEITEIKLYEGSAVLWGANENTPTVSVKSVQDLDDEFSKTIKSLRNWKGTEEGYELLELKLMQLNSFYKKALTESNPVNPLVESNPQFDEQAVKEQLTLLETKFLLHETKWI